MGSGKNKLDTLCSLLYHSYVLHHLFDEFAYSHGVECEFSTVYDTLRSTSQPVERLKGKRDFLAVSTDHDFGT